MTAPLTMETVAALLGYPKPVRHRQRVCAQCGCDEFMWGDEFIGLGATPNSTGRTVEFCADCGALTGEVA